MISKELYLKNLTGKDEVKAIEAASYLVESSDIELFKMLVEKSDYLFDFVRGNIGKRIKKVVNQSNFKNLICFFAEYSQYYDDLFSSILANYADEDLTDEMYEMLENGTSSQKTYCAKYFSYIPDTVSVDLLTQYALCDDETLAYNAAEALGQMNDELSHKNALEALKLEDDFEKLKAVKFFVAYGKNYPVDDIITALKNSKMPENIAGQIPYIVRISELIKLDKKMDMLIVLDSILSGLGEILPLSEIFQFELYDLINYLIEENRQKNEFSGKISAVLLNAYSKFKLFSENQEYVFDEDKETKAEVASIWELISSQNIAFWDMQKEFLVDELYSTEERVLAVLPIITELKIKNVIPDVKKLVDSDNEIVVCEALSCLKIFNALDDVDIKEIASRITNENIKIFIENLKA